MLHKISPEAESDLDSIWFYIATESGSVEIADRFVDVITERFYLLTRHPHVGRRRDETLREAIRSFPVGEYIIFYRVEQTDVFILRVISGRRDVTNF